MKYKQTNLAVHAGVAKLANTEMGVFGANTCPSIVAHSVLTYLQWKKG